MARRFSARLQLLLAIPLLFSMLPVISAQDTPAKTQAPADIIPVKSGKSKASAAAAKDKIDQQKALALSLLVTLSNDARSYQDQKPVARAAFSVADALWEPDPEQGRALFRKPGNRRGCDEETARKLNEERQRQQGGDPTARRARWGSGPAREVLRLAAGMIVRWARNSWTTQRRSPRETTDPRRRRGKYTRHSGCGSTALR